MLIHDRLSFKTHISKAQCYEELNVAKSVKEYEQNKRCSHTHKLFLHKA